MVYETSNTVLVLPVGQTVTLLDAVVRQQHAELEIKPWTEVYLWRQ